jgi:hypothetical protein
MKPRTFVFVAAQTAFGEAVLGLRIAHELHARGDRIVVLAGELLSVLTSDTPFRAIAVTNDEFNKGVARVVARVVAEVHADAVVLLDATLVYWLLKGQKADATFLRTVGVPVIGLDVWNTRETGLTWDVCGTTWEHSVHSLEVSRRLVPVPFARPTGLPGLYNALPPPFSLDADERQDLRADFGVGPKDRLLLLTSARWQHPTAQAHESGRRLAANLPSLAAELIGRLGPNVRVAHVGPEAYPMPSVGGRYTWLSQRTPARFAKLLASSDLLVTFNFSATTIVSAISSGLPVVLGINSHGGSVDAICERLAERPSGPVRAWLKRASPVSRYRVWPLGLHDYLTSTARDNPYTSALVSAEVLEESRFVEAMRALLFDEAARADLRHRQASYREQVEKLPRAADLIDAYLKS